MDVVEWDVVTDSTWSFHLPEILHALSDCSFVAIDFEFSGIASHRDLPSRHQTLQERYVDTKEAAQKYQILQVGLTIAHEDPSSGTYTLKPYNLHLSPLIDPVLGIDRTFSVSSAAVQFLMKTGFKMQTPFTEGVPYLTKKEEEQALKEACRHSSHSRTESIAQMELPKEDAESVAFLASVRKEIDRWLSLDKPVEDFLNVPSRKSKPSNGKPDFTSLNRFQKRLVHQLVEKEYPSLVSIGRNDFVRIVRYDKQREESILQQKIQRVEKRLAEHRGFRWIIESLTGGDLRQLETKMFDHLVVDCGKFTRQKAVQDFTENIKSKLQKKRAPVVGHNLFTDVIYMWQCFVGDLPDRVEDFIKSVHEKFPLLIDTKYIFTHDCGDINPVASLDVMNEAFKAITKPEIVIDSKHARYQHKQHLHEAGYDSLLTAKNFIKQAVQLPEARTKVSQSAHANEHECPKVKSKDKGIKTVSAAKPPDANSLSMAELRSRFAHKNVFDTLPIDLGDAESEELSVDDEEPLLIPSFSSPVWKIYGNKLRVFGTDERVCALDPDA